MSPREGASPLVNLCPEAIQNVVNCHLEAPIWPHDISAIAETSMRENDVDRGYWRATVEQQRSKRMLTAWTTYDELTADQKARFGGYVKAREEAQKGALAEQRASERARVLLNATGGDTQRAFAAAMKGVGR